MFAAADMTSYCLHVCAYDLQSPDLYTSSPSSLMNKLSSHVSPLESPSLAYKLVFLTSFYHLFLFYFLPLSQPDILTNVYLCIIYLSSGNMMPIY